MVSLWRKKTIRDYIRLVDEGKNIISEATTLFKKGLSATNEGTLGLITYVLATESARVYTEYEKEQLNKTLQLNLRNDLHEEKEQIMKYKGITIHKNSSCNTWYTRVRKNGKQIYISAKTQRECYIKLKKTLDESAKSIQLKNTTLKEWYYKWLKLYKIGKVKESTIFDYEKLLKNLDRLLDLEIQSITVENVLTTLNKISAERQRQKSYELLNAIFKKALDNEIISKNIMTRIDKPEHTKQNGRALTKHEEEILIEKSKQIKYGDLYLVALYQGLRKGEVLGITDKDIDFVNNTINIDKAINNHNKFDTTKNDFSIRKMPMFNKTKEILLKYSNTSGRIFDISYNKIDKYTKRLQELVGFDFSIKFMRYTFITRCQEMNIPEFIIQSWCGHRIGSKITKQVYTKFNPEDNTKYINILNEGKFYSNSTQ